MLGWVLLKRLCAQDPNHHMKIYILGAALLMFFLPLIFVPELCVPWVIFLLACTFKVGSGLMIISQLTIIPKITSNRSRRVHLTQQLSANSWRRTRSSDSEAPSWPCS